MTDRRDEPFEIEGDAEAAQRDRLKVDPDAPPAKPNEDHPVPERAAKDQGDMLSEDLEK